MRDKRKHVRKHIRRMTLVLQKTCPKCKTRYPIYFEACPNCDAKRKRRIVRK